MKSWTWIVAAFVASLCLVSAVPGPDDQPIQPIKDVLRDGKRKFAQSQLNTELQSREALSMKPAFPLRLGTLNGTAASTFRSFNQSFVLVEKVLYRLADSSTSASHFNVMPVAKFQDFLGPVAFVESVEWENLLYLLAGYEEGLLQLFTVSPNNVTLRQAIKCEGIPTGAEFFKQDDKLYLVVVAKSGSSKASVKIYRWYGTQLDQQNKVYEAQATAVTTFPFRQSMIIVVAVDDPSSHKEGLVVFQHTGNKLLAVQFFPVPKPCGLQHFLFQSENFLFVTSTSGRHEIIWWSGTEMIAWSVLESDSPVHSVGVAYVRGETILAISEKVKISFYRPTDTAPQLIDTQNSSTAVQSASLFTHNESLSLLTILESNGNLIPYVVNLNLVFLPAAVGHANLARDPLLQCLSNVENVVKLRDSQLKKIVMHRSQLVRKSSSGRFTGKLFVKKLQLNNADIRSPLNTNSRVTSAAELIKKTEKLMDYTKTLNSRLTNVVFKSLPSSLSGRLIAKELVINITSMDSVVIPYLNGKSFNPHNILMYSKDQTMTGIVSVGTLVSDQITVSSLNDVEVDDFMRRSGHQTIEGLEEVTDIKANRVVFVTPRAVVNNIPLQRIVTVKYAENTAVSGIKTFTGLNLQQLAVNLLNNVNFNEWINSLQQTNPLPPTMDPSASGANKAYRANGDLHLQELNVTGSINGVQFDDLISDLFLKGLKQDIFGELILHDEVSVENLKVKEINKVPSLSLFTRTTPQVLSGSLTLESLSTPALICKDLNGLQMSTDAAYLNSSHPVSTAVVFDRLQATELYIPPKASIAGQTIGTHLLTPPKIVYKGTVTIKGALRLFDADFSNAKVQVKDTTVNLTNIELLYWTRHSHQTIPGSIYASKGLRVRSLNVKTINNRAVEKYVDLSTTESLQGSWHFLSASINGDISHEPQAQQTPVSPHYLSSVVVKSSGNYTLSGSKIFAGGVAVAHLITDYIDSVKVIDILSGNLGKGNLMAKDLWIANNLVIHSNLNVGSVNGEKLCERLQKAVLIDSNAHIPAAVISVVSSSNIIVKTINSVPFSDASRPHGSPRMQKITIKGDVRVPYFTNVININQKQVAKDILSRVVDRTQSGIISGKKTFESRVIVKGSFSAPDINGLNLMNLFENMFSKTGSQIIRHRIKIKSMKTRGLEATVVNRVDIRNLLTFDSLSRQIVKGDLIFTSHLDVMPHLLTSTFEENCNLTLVNERLQTVHARHWDSLIVEGKLNWDKSLPDKVHGLGFYLKSAVVKNKDQVISGEVLFLEDVEVFDFDTQKDIDDISISGIWSDSLRKSMPDQVVHSSKIFNKSLNSSSMRVKGNVVAKTVANVDIVPFNNSLVRVRGNQDVRGHKRFLQGFSANLLTVKGLNNGTVNGLLTTDVATYDMETLPAIKFVAPLEITGDLTFEIVNDFNFAQLLQDRVKLDSTQNVRSRITFERDLTIKGNMVAPIINSLDISDIVLRNSLNEQVIGGRKNFLQGLRVDGPVEVDRLKGVNLRWAYEAALFKDDNATIDGNLVFRNIVTMGPNLEVDTTVNGVEIMQLAKSLRNSTPRNHAQVRSIAQTISDVNVLLNARSDLSEMLYVDPVMDVPVSFTNTFHAVSTRISNHESYLDVYGWASPSLCGLPDECACPVQYSVHVGSEDLKSVSWTTGIKHNTSERSFTFHSDDPPVKVVVKTNTVSSSSQCRLLGVNSLNEFTVLSWVKIKGIQESDNINGEVTLQISPEPIYGYIGDVKGISHQGHIYLFLAIAYNAEYDKTDVNSVVVRVDMETRRAIIVDEFPTHGVSSLDVFHTSRGYQIAVGNSYDSSRGSSQTSLDIYRFDVVSEKMIHKKSIPADGIISVVSVVQGGDDLIIVAQKQLFTPVMVLKYDAKHDDYHFMQQLNPNSIPTGLGTFYIGQPGRSDAFLGVSTADNQFHLYKFSHIEGFKPVMKIELQGVQGFTTFSVGSKQYLLFTSTSSPSVFEIVKQVAN